MARTPLIGKTKLTQPSEIEEFNIIKKKIDEKAANKTFRLYDSDLERLETLKRNVSKLSARKITYTDIVRTALNISCNFPSKRFYVALRKTHK